MIQITVSGTEIYGKLDTKLTSGTVGRVVNFTFDEKWNGLSKTAVFRVGNDCRSQYLGDKDSCEFPWELLTHNKVGQIIHIGICGMHNTEIVYPTIYTYIGELAEGANPSADPSIEHSPELIEQLITVAEEAKAVAQSVRDDADAGRFDGDAAQTDQTYNPESEHAQSGKAVAQAVENAQSKISLNNGTGKDSLAQPYCNAICDNNTALGVETTAGIRGFKINSIHIDSDYALLDIGDGINHYDIGDIVNIDATKHWYNRYKIVETMRNRIIDEDKEPFTGIVIEAIYPDLYPVSEANLSLGPDDTDNWVWVDGKNAGEPIDQYKGGLATGIRTLAAGYGAFAAGRDTKAIGNYSTALGRQTIADYASFAVGLRTHALGQQSFAGGADTKALGVGSFAFGGSDTTAYGKFSMAVGTGVLAQGDYSVAFGNQTIAQGNNQFVVGQANAPLGYPALFIVGNGYIDDDGTLVRQNVFVVNTYGAEINGKSVATIDIVSSMRESAIKYTDSKCSTINLTQNSKWNNFALQCDTQIGSIRQIGGSSTNPNTNTASEAGAVALGTGTTASGQYAVALGGDTTASGKFAFSAGYGTTASGAHSVALGNGSIASGGNSLAQGWKSEAKADCAVAINCATTAESPYSFAQGQRSKATKSCAAAFNYYTQANGANSASFGNQTKAGYDNQLVAGSYNNNKSDTIFEVGAGTSSARANCFETGKDKDGNSFITVGATRITEAQLIKLLTLIS